MLNKLQKEPVPITCIDALLSIKDDVKAFVRHKGRGFEIAYEAYRQIRKAYGHPKPNMKLCRDACIRQMNKILNNWLNQFEKAEGKMGTEPLGKSTDMQYDTEELNVSLQDAINPSSGDKLVPIDDRRKILLAWDWYELRKEAIEQLGDEVFKALNGKKPPKKDQVVEALLKL